MNLATIIRTLILTLSASVLLQACGGGGGGGGQDCASNANCPVGEYCNFEDLSCGTSGLPGRCTTIPIDDCNAAGSSDIAGPVCSCERLTFNNQCWAESAGQSIAAAGECP